MRHKLIEARKQIGMTQAQVALTINTTKQYISYLENGKSHPSLDVAFRLSALYNVDIDPQDKVYSAFEHLMYLPTREIYQVADVLGFTFDPYGLFKESE